MPIFGRNGIGLGNAFKGMSSFLNPDRAYRRAGQQSEQAFGQAQQYLQPYEQQGQAAYQPLNQAMQSLLNPGQMENDWRAQYQMSPYAQMQQEQARNQGLDAASSMGLMGSSPALQAIQGGVNRAGVEDQERYLDRMMQKYGMGVQMAHGLYNQGGNFASQMGQNAMQQGQNRAGAAYGQYGAPGAMMGNLIGLGVGALGGGMGGGQMGGQRQIAWNQPQGGGY